MALANLGESGEGKKKSAAINLTRTAGKMKYCVFLSSRDLIAVVSSSHAQCVTRAAGTCSASCFSILMARDVDMCCLKAPHVSILVIEVAFEKVFSNQV